MPKKCSVFDCTTNRDCYEPGVRFFHIPREDEELQARWLQVIGRDRNWKIPTVPTVCQKHFTPEQIFWGRNLNSDVIPTLNLPDPAKDDNRHSKVKDAPQTKPGARSSEQPLFLQ